MREYRYTALTTAGQTISGVRHAPSAEVLAADLLEQRLVLLRSRVTLGSLGRAFSASRRAARRELREFTRHMATCLQAGIPALTAIGDYQSGTAGAFADILADIRGDVSSGTALDESLARHPHVFSPLYLSLIRAGQNSGTLDRSFGELVDYLDWNDDLRAQTTQAMIYPAMLLTAIVGLFLLMTLFVIPRFEEVFAGAHFELPTLTRNVLAAGDWLGRWWWLVLGAAGAAAVAGSLAVRSERGAWHRDRLLLRLPVYGNFVRKLALSRFSKTFSLVFAAGVDLLQVLALTRDVVDNRVLAGQLAAVRSRVAAGESLREAFADADAFPLLVQRLVAVGEQTGSLESSLQTASVYYDKEIPRDLKRAFTVFEALVIVLLGVLVCVAALALLMPIMSLRPQG